MISGDDVPVYAELTWQTLKIGDVEFEVTISNRHNILSFHYDYKRDIIICLQQDSVCERCNMVNIDQDTSDSYCKPLSILVQHKKQGKSLFGIYIKRYDDTQKYKIRVGQQCFVNDKKP